MSTIKRNLPNDQYQAALQSTGANDANPFVTESVTNGLQNQISQIAPGLDNVLLSGSVTWSGSGLTYNITNCTYRIQGVDYISEGGQQTLDPFDLTNDRLDVIYVNTTPGNPGFTGSFGYAVGTPDPNPVEPTLDGSTQLKVATILVTAGQATPPGASITQVYDEDAGEPTEWSFATTGTLSLNTGATISPIVGSTHIDVSGLSNWSSGDSIEITYTGGITLPTEGNLVFFIKISEGWTTFIKGITIDLFNGVTQVGSLIGVGNNQPGGFVSNNTNWQQVVLPIDTAGGPVNFNAAGQTIDKIRIRGKGPGSYNNAFYLDDIYIEDTGGATTPPPTGINLDDLLDVDVTTTLPSNQSALLYNSTSNKWETGSVATGETASTGLLTGGILSVNGGDNTKFDVSDGSGQFVTAAGVKTQISWTGKTAIAITNILSNNITFVGINQAGTIIQQTTPFTPLQSRTIIVFGVVVHVNNQFADVVNNEQQIAYNVNSQLYDAMESIGFFNVNGNLFTANGANLAIDKSAGIMFKMGSNYDIDVNNPHQRTLAGVTNARIQYRFSDNTNGELNGSITAFADAGGGQVTVTSNGHGLVNNHEVTIAGTTNYNGTYYISNVTLNTFDITATWVVDDATGTWDFLGYTNVIDPDNLDNGTGGFTPVSNNQWSIQRIYVFTSNNIKLQRGVQSFATLDAAIAGLSTEPYVTEPSIAANGLLRGWLIVKKGATDLSDIAQAQFLAAPKFASGDPGATGGQTNLQSAYSNSTANPEILTDATGGSLTVRRGSAADTDDVFEVQNGAGTQTFAVDGNGNITTSGTVDGRDVATDGTKLDGIEPNATADQNASEVSYTNTTSGLTATDVQAAIDEVEARVDANDAKVSNVSTSLSIGTQTGTTLAITSDGGADDVILPEVIASGNAGLLSGADKAKLDGIEALADVTDAANVDAAGAVMNTDTTTAAMSFVVDEDNMASDLDTKVPTQQSVKAYVDSKVASSVEYQGGYDASAVAPNGSATKGDMYTVTVAGTGGGYFTTALEIGDVIISEIDSPTTETDWTVVNKDLDAASIKTSYESNANTNAFTDADVTNLGNQSGTNTGDQTITLTGDVTGSGTGSFAATIANDSVTLAKMQNAVANSKLVGSGSAGAGADYVELTVGTNLTMTGTTLSADAQAGTTNLGYTSTATDGTVTSDTGTDATITLATPTGGTNLAGLLSPGDKDKLDNTSGTNTGDEVAATTTVAGIAEIATAAEIDTGTDDTRVISPLGLANSQLQSDVTTNNAKVSNVTTNLGYTASPSDGTVTSSDGTDATLPLATGVNAGLLAPGDFTTLGNTSGTNTGDQTITLTGDVTGSGTGSFAATIAADSVTYDKMQDIVANNTFLGNDDGANSTVQELTAAEARTILNVEDGADVTDATNVAAAGAVMDSDISAAEGFLRKTGAGAYEAIKSNLNASVAPGTGDDNTAGYAVGSVWIDTTGDAVYQAVDVTTAAAVWKDLSAAGGGISNVVEDTTPQLGGDLDLNGNNITAAGPTTISSTEVSYLDGVTSNIQTQLNGKLANVVEDTTPQLGGTLDSNAKQIRWSKGADVASATALTLGTDGNEFDITGTTTITSINTLAVGTVVVLHFDAALTLTHNAADLILPGGANITTAAGDIATFYEYAAGDWRCINYSKASGEAVVSGGGGGFTVSRVTDSTMPATAVVDTYYVIHTLAGNFTGNLPAVSGNSGKRIGFKVEDDLVGGETVTIDGSGAETIDGVTTQGIYNQWDSMILICDGTQWLIES